MKIELFLGVLAIIELVVFFVYSGFRFVVIRGCRVFIFFLEIRVFKIFFVDFFSGRVVRGGFFYLILG